MEIILLDDGGEIVLWYPLSRSCHSLELSESFWIMDALLEKVKLWLTHSHLPIKSEKALSGIVEWLEANWLEGKVLRVASQHIESLLLAFLGMLGDHVVGVSLIFISNNLLSALVKVNVGEDQVLNCWNIIHFVKVEVNLHTPRKNKVQYSLTRS